MPNHRPNVLIILTDQFNPYFGGWEGDPVRVTPNLDRLADEGMDFRCAYTVGPVCMPARCSFISGLYPHQHGYWTNFTDQVFPAPMGGFYRDVRAAGYHTAYVGKTHWFNPDWGEHVDAYDDYFAALGIETMIDIPGTYLAAFQRSAYTDVLKQEGMLETFLRDIAQQMQAGQYAVVPSLTPAELQPDAVTGHMAAQFLDSYADDRPFCLTVSFPGPHTPLNAPDPYATMVDPADVVLPPNVPEHTRWEGRMLSRDDIRRMRANYYGKIALIDDWCGHIFDALEQRAQWQDTLVVFSADHGDMMGAHGTLSKCKFWEESARVPLLVRWPGRIPAGTTTDALAELIDVYPTVVEAAGGSVSGWCCGQSLLPVAESRSETVRDAAFSEFWGRSPQPGLMIRTPRHKYFRQGKHEYLYDMQDDPFELQNLAGGAESEELSHHLSDRIDGFLNRSRSYQVLFDRAHLSADSPDLARELNTLFRQLHGLD